MNGTNYEVPYCGAFSSPPIQDNFLILNVNDWTSIKIGGRKNFRKCYLDPLHTNSTSPIDSFFIFNVNDLASIKLDGKEGKNYNSIS